MGNRVEPDDLVGVCSVERPLLLLDVAGALGVPPSELPRRMRAMVGTHVAFRDVLARRRRRSVLAPTNGTISAIDPITGFVTLAPDAEPASLAATIKGYVAVLEPNQGITIETAAAIVQGVVGFGPEQWGVLRLLVTDRGDMITAEMVDARSAYSLVIGGAGITADALRKAQAEQVKGVIVGSIEARELRDYLGPQWHGDWQRALSTGTLTPPSPDAPTLLVTEGFGTHPMSQPLFDMLTRYDRQEALLQGHTRLTNPEHRPRLVVPLARLPGGEAAPPPAPVIQRGAVVRIGDEQHRGEVGKVVVANNRGVLPSGVRTATATVQIGADERVVLPQTALEVIDLVKA